MLSAQCAKAPTPSAPSATCLRSPPAVSADTFGTERDLPPLTAGDLVALTNAGAYGAVMASTYNSRLLVPEILVAGQRFAVIRARPSYDAMLGLDSVPGWLAGAPEEASRTRGAA